MIRTSMVSWLILAAKSVETTTEVDSTAVAGAEKFMDSNAKAAANAFKIIALQLYLIQQNPMLISGVNHHLALLPFNNVELIRQ